MISISSTDAGNETSFSKPTASRTNVIYRPAALSKDGANAEPAKKKFTSGKTGSSTITIYRTTKDAGAYRLKPLLESPLLNRNALQTILQKLKPREWFSCPSCKTEWNRLAPSVVCINCEDNKEKNG